MRGENARLGVETTTRSDHIARSATKPRSSSSTDQRHSARPDRSWLEKAQHSGPRIGSSSRPMRGYLVMAEKKGPFGTFTTLLYATCYAAHFTWSSLIAPRIAWAAAP